MLCPPQAEKMRAEFDCNALLDDPNQIERALVRGEEKLSSHLHPDPYIGKSIVYELLIIYLDVYLVVGL